MLRQIERIRHLTDIDLKTLLLICALLLLLAMASLPIGYYTLLRITVTVGALAVVFTEFENGINFWVIAFGLMAILFNPLFPIYLNDRSSWLPIDTISAILFGIKSLTLKSDKNE